MKTRLILAGLPAILLAIAAVTGVSVAQSAAQEGESAVLRVYSDYV